MTAIFECHDRDEVDDKGKHLGRKITEMDAGQPVHIFLEILVEDETDWLEHFLEAFYLFFIISENCFSIVFSCSVGLAKLSHKQTVNL